MSMNYNKLWKLLIDKNMKKTDLVSVAGISTNALAKMGKGGDVSTQVLRKICEALDCNIEDIVEIDSVVDITSIGEELGMKIDEFKSKIHIDKVYIENHRGSITIPVERLKSVKDIVESRNLIASGGITCTSLVNNIRKPAIFDTYCYTDPDRNGGGWIDPYPEFPNDTTTVLFTESTAEREDSMEILEKFVRDGGNAIVTMGYFKKMYDKGIKDLTSVRLTGRHVIGSRYMIQNANSWNNKIINSFLSSSTQRKLWNKVYDALK